MKTAKATALDVARHAGVSQPTVSRIFTPSARVSPDLIDRVRTTAHELGYRPNMLARSLITGRSKTIGLIVAYLKNPFYPEAIEKLSEALSQEGYHILVFFAANLAEEVDPAVEDLLDHQVDGIILASVSMSNRLTDRPSEEGIPFVLFNRGQENPDLAQVTAANFDGGRKAGRFLATGGHRRIAHISGWQKSLNVRDRQAGFIAGLEEAGLQPLRCIDSHYRRSMAIKATHELMAPPARPDAIFVGNDHMAFAVIETLRHDLGLRVPEDVSVVGYDDVQMAAWKTYDLTTLRQPDNRRVDATVHLLLRMIGGDNTGPHKIEIDSPLIVRGSARVPEGWSHEGRWAHQSGFEIRISYPLETRNDPR